MIFLWCSLTCGPFEKMWTRPIKVGVTATKLFGSNDNCNLNFEAVLVRIHKDFFNRCHSSLFFQSCAWPSLDQQFLGPFPFLTCPTQNVCPVRVNSLSSYLNWNRRSLYRFTFFIVLASFCFVTQNLKLPNFPQTLKISWPGNICPKSS